MYGIKLLFVFGMSLFCFLVTFQYEYKVLSPFIGILFRIHTDNQQNLVINSLISKARNANLVQSLDEIMFETHVTYLIW